jgi:thiamine pyrophosphate-dependent acetolactate synthase large subunit-like protein
MLSSGSLGTMGVALGYSIGAKLANADKMVIAVDGDGSFNMTIGYAWEIGHGFPHLLVFIVRS